MYFQLIVPNSGLNGHSNYSCSVTLELTDVSSQHILESLLTLSFCDASEHGYCTVTYLVQQNNSYKVHWAFAMGKARVAPLKPVTIPRLELTAAAMAGRVDRMLRRELELQLADSVFWTDSTAVLKYVNDETTRSHTFVANRVSEILYVSTASQWRHVSSNFNPADYASRGKIGGHLHTEPNLDFGTRLPHEAS